MHRSLAIALLAVHPGCIYDQGALGVSTPVAGELDRGAQARFAGTAGVGTGYIGRHGGGAGGIAVERVAPGQNHAGLGAWGLIAVPVRDWLHGFGRVTYTSVIDTPNTKCTPALCGRSLGIAIGAHLVGIRDPEPDADGDVPDAPLIFGAGLALAYQRVDLDGAIGHFIGIELTFLVGGAIVTSHAKN